MLGRSARFAYDAQSTLTSLTDMGGLTTTIAYNTNLWPASVTYPNGQSLTFTYPMLNTTNTEWLGDAFLMNITDPSGHVHEYYYHASTEEGPIGIKDPGGNDWYFAKKTVGGDRGGDLLYFAGVNGSARTGYYANPWAEADYDAEMNLTSVAYALDVLPAVFDWTTSQTNLQVHHVYDTHHNVLRTLVYTNIPETGLVLVSAVTNAYDAHDNLLATTNSLGQTLNLGYDEADQLVAVTNALNQVTTLAYSGSGQLTNVTDALGRSNAWVYGPSGYELESIAPDGSRLGKKHDAIGRLMSVTNQNTGLVLNFTRDDLDRVTSTVFPDATSNYVQYGCCGPELIRNRIGQTTYLLHDVEGRVSQVTDPLNRITEFHYNGAQQVSELITHVGGQARVKQFEYAPTNGLTQLRQVITPLGKTTGYGYSFRGQLTRMTNGNGQVVSLDYNLLGGLATVSVGNQTVMELGYTMLGQPVYVASEYSVFQFTNDALNRATSMVCTLTNIPGFAAVQYQLDYQFDAVGNVTNRQLTGLQSFTGSLQTEYRYNPVNQLTNVIQRTNGVQAAQAGYRYAPGQGLTDKLYGNGDQVHYEYDLENRLRSLTISNGTAEVKRYGYQMDASGQILAITNGTQVSQYSYDAANQLTNEVITGVLTNAWEYDEAGNWTGSPGQLRRVYNSDNELVCTSTSTTNSVTVSGSVSPGPRSNKWYQTYAECRAVRARVSTNDGTFVLNFVPLEAGTNQLVVTVTDVSGNQSRLTNTVFKQSVEDFRHDGNGALTNWNTGVVNWQYEWDWADRLIRVSSNGVVVLQNWYDALSRRVAKLEVGGGVTNKCMYVYDGLQIIAVLNDNGQVIETFTRGVGLAGDVGTLVAVTHHAASATTNGTFYAHNNHRGDVVTLRSDGGTVATVLELDYAPFGAIRSQTGLDLCRFKFSSKERDRTAGLSYYGYRFYHPELQRWLNHDPIEEEGGLNFYQFVRNNPVYWLDPFGEEPGVELTTAIAAGDAVQIETILTAYEGILSPAQTAMGRAALANIARQQALKAAAKQCVRLTQNQLQKYWGKNIHAIKNQVLKQFSKELKKAGCTNPNMAIDPNGNLVLQCPNGIVIPTGLSPSLFVP
ncbi:MAG: RHS repeat-associated core domain-containing protein [Verrucomicrobiota bacterium]